MATKVDQYMMDISQITVALDTPMMKVLRIMTELNMPAVVVWDVNHEVKGIITGTDVVFHLDKNIDSSTLRDGIAESVMTANVSSVRSGSLIVDAVNLMVRRRLHTLIVTSENVPVGVLTQLDIIRWWFEHHGQTRELLP